MSSRSIRSSFQKKLLARFLVAGFVPLLVCIILVTILFRVTLNSSTENRAERQLADMSERLHTLVLGCDDVLEQLQESELVLAALTGEREATEVYSFLYDATGQMSRQATFSLYDGEGQLLYTTGTAAPGERLPLNWGLLYAAREGAGLICRRASEYDKVRHGSMQLARAVWGEDEIPAGYVTAELSDDCFRHLFEGTYDSGNDILVLDRFWGTVYASPTLHDETLAPRLRAQLLEGESLSIAGSNCTYYVQEEPASGFALVMQQPKPVADWIMQLLLWVTVAALLLSLLLGSQFSMAFSREIFEPIRELNTAMARIEEGDLAVRLEVRGTDEISQLLERFNLMAGRLKENLDNSIRQQQELGDAQIRMMQAQLNPHFLYNTLDTLKWLGKINRIPEVSTISANLADILRSSISADDFVRLGDELALLERYVEIQNIRFPDKFVYQTDIEDETREMLIPKLTLQPLVENAIIHGFEDGSHGVITVSAAQRGDELTVTVQDDGCGMSPDSRARFLAKSGAASGHLGLYNVDAILRLHYGEKCGLKFLSPRDGRGTCIRMTLPVRTRTDKEDATL